MTVWIVLGAIVAALVLLSLIRVGGTVEYSRSGTLVHLRAGPLHIQVYPPKPRKKSGEKKPKRAKKSSKPQEEQTRLLQDYIESKKRMFKRRKGQKG